MFHRDRVVPGAKKAAGFLFKMTQFRQTRQEVSRRLGSPWLKFSMSSVSLLRDTFYPPLVISFLQDETETRQKNQARFERKKKMEENAHSYARVRPSSEVPIWSTSSLPHQKRISTARTACHPAPWREHTDRKAIACSVGGRLQRFVTRAAQP